MLEFVNAHQILFLSVAILIGAVVFSRISSVIVHRYLQRESIQLKAEYTKYRFLSYVFTSLIWFLAIAAIFWMQPKLRALATSLFAGAGIVLVFVGLAAQTAFANIVGGVFIIVFKPFRLGDMIQVGNLSMGIVVDITLRHTVIRNFENNHIIIPNANINSEVVVNNSILDEKVCRHITFGISYDSNVDLAMKIIREESEKHPNTIDVRTKEDIKGGVPYIRVRMINYGESSIDLKAWVWVDKWTNGFATHCDILQSVKARFDAEGVEIPFPYRTLVYKKDLPDNA